MRTIAIAKRVTKELLRDKRTLMLMFLAPILILFLMKLVFSVNATTDVKVATVNVSNSLVTQLDKTSHLTVLKYDNVSKATQAMSDKKVDAVIHSVDNDLYVNYSNIDASKTKATKSSLKMSILLNSLQQMQKNLQPLGQRIVQPKIHQKYHYGNADTNFFDKIVPILMGFLFSSLFS